MTESDVLALVRARAAWGEGAALGVVGGTFDPVHRGHTALGEAARGELGLDGVLYIPAGVPSFKRDREVAPGPERLALVELAVAGLPGSAASGREVARPGITYTVDTLEGLRAELPAGVRLVFVMGADALETLPLWHRAADLARLAEVACAPRVGCAPPEGAARRAREAGFSVTLLGTPVPEVSSTEVRGRLRSGAPLDGLLDPAVERRIRARGLYGARPAG